MSKSKKLPKNNKLDLYLFRLVSFFSFFSLIVFTVFISFSLPLDQSKQPEVFLQSQGGSPYHLSFYLYNGNPEVKVGETEKLVVVLYDENNLPVTDQWGIYYEWSAEDDNLVQITNTVFPDSCDFGIKKPCPNFAVDLLGKYAGETDVWVVAKHSSMGILGIASVNVRVLSEYGDNSTRINYKYRLKGINKEPVDKTKQLLRITGEDEPFPSFLNAALGGEPDGDGVYHSYVRLDYMYMNNSNYKVCIKGIKHLQKCFENILFKGGQDLDFTSYPLEAGDLPLDEGGMKQDGVIDDRDFNYLWEHRGSSKTKDLSIGDLNMDGAINMGDMSLLLQGLVVKHDEKSKYD